MLVVCRAAGLCPRFWVVFRSDPIKSYSSGCTAAPAPSTTPPPLSLCLGPCLRQARENVVLFLEGTATCRPKGWMEPEWAVISAITCAHVTGLKPQKARNYCCLSISITKSLNTSRGATQPPHLPLQLGGNSCFLTICSEAGSLLSKATWNNLAQIPTAAVWQWKPIMTYFHKAHSVAAVPCYKRSVNNYPVVLEDMDIGLLMRK